jgi:hypothetical protein
MLTSAGGVRFQRFLRDTEASTYRDRSTGTGSTSAYTGPDLTAGGDRCRRAFAATLGCRAVAVGEGVRVHPGLKRLLIAPAGKDQPRTELTPERDPSPASCGTAREQCQRVGVTPGWGVGCEAVESVGLVATLVSTLQF